MARLTIQVFSDIACPWCYVGKRRLEAALALFEHRACVDIVWKAFELDPTLPVRVPLDGPDGYAARLAKKYGRTTSQAKQMIDGMTRTAAEDGLAFRFDIIAPGNTFNAHRILHLASEKSYAVQDAVKERLLRAYMCEGECVGEPDTLQRLACEAGLPGDEVAAVLASDKYAADVRADEETAHLLGVTGVPFFVVFDRLGVSGAQSAETLAEAMRKAWAKVPLAERPDAVAAACGPEGCKL